MPSLASHLGGQVINYEAWPAAKGLCWPAPAWGAESANSGELVRPWGRAGAPLKGLLWPPGGWREVGPAARPAGLSSLSTPLEEAACRAGGQSGFYADSR